jgi:hypothetical protein
MRGRDTLRFLLLGGKRAHIRLIPQLTRELIPE